MLVPHVMCDQHDVLRGSYCFVDDVPVQNENEEIGLIRGTTRDNKDYGSIYESEQRIDNVQRTLTGLENPCPVMIPGISSLQREWRKTIG